MLNGLDADIGAPLIQRFIDICDSDGEKIAVTANGVVTTYQQLRFCMSRYVSALQHIQPRVVMVQAERDEKLIALLLACQALGVPYIPVDPSCSHERLRHMIEMTGASLVSEKAEEFNCPEDNHQPAIKVYSIDGLLSDGKDLKTVELTSRSNVDSYWIYTSGSTGEPKCVVVPEVCCANLIDAFSRTIPPMGTFTWLSATSIAFDIFYLEYALPLAFGGCVELLSNEECKSPQKIAARIEAVNPTVFQGTPSVFKCVAPYLSDGFAFDKVLVGGEAITSSIASFLVSRSDWLCNVYGPTETTVWSTTHVITSADDIRIGKPINNTSIFILGENDTPLGRGEEGRIFIGGAGVTKGYFRNEGLTSEKFKILNLQGKDEVFYETGDIGFVDSQDCLNYVRREGDFFKINGFRVDPIEIREALEKVTDIDEAGVVVTESRPEGEDIIVAFYKRRPGSAPIEKSDLINSLKKRLPNYLLPSHVFCLDSFPYTVSGKLDNKKLVQKYKSLSGFFVEAEEDVSKAENVRDPIIMELSKYIDVSGLDDHENIFQRGLTSMSAVLFHVDLMRMSEEIELYHIFDRPTVSGIREILN